MLSMEFIKSEKKTYQQQIKDLEEQVKFFKNKSQRVEKVNKKLKDNWNELKKFIEKRIKDYEKHLKQGYDATSEFEASIERDRKILKQMQELEQGKDD